MSERGSFVTEYIYCQKCFDAVSAGLRADADCWVLPASDVPIVAGLISASYSGGEMLSMLLLIDKFSPALCHDVRIAVLAEVGQQVLTAMAHAGLEGATP